MDYNTQRPGLKLREYGRNIQYMVEQLQGIEDEERRNKAAYALIDLMGQMNPHLRIEEFRPKLWDHLLRMSNYELEVNFPYDLQDLKDDNYDPNCPPYPSKRIKMKQYGKNVENLIKKALEIEDKDKQQAFARTIGNYMKMVSASGYKEHIDNETIREDLKVLSGGKLTIDEASNLDRLTQSNSHKTRREDTHKSKNGHNNKQKRYKGNTRNNNNDNRNNNNRNRPKSNRYSSQSRSTPNKRR